MSLLEKKLETLEEKMEEITRLIEGLQTDIKDLETSIVSSISKETTKSFREIGFTLMGIAVLGALAKYFGIL